MFLISVSVHPFHLLSSAYYPLCAFLCVHFYFYPLHPALFYLCISIVLQHFFLCAFLLYSALLACISTMLKHFSACISIMFHVRISAVFRHCLTRKRIQEDDKCSSIFLHAFLFFPSISVRAHFYCVPALPHAENYCISIAIQYFFYVFLLYSGTASRGKVPKMSTLCVHFYCICLCIFLCIFYAFFYAFLLCSSIFCTCISIMIRSETFLLCLLCVYFHCDTTKTN